MICSFALDDAVAVGAVATLVSSKANRAYRNKEWDDDDELEMARVSMSTVLPGGNPLAGATLYRKSSGTGFSILLLLLSGSNDTSLFQACSAKGRYNP